MIIRVERHLSKVLPLLLLLLAIPAAALDDVYLVRHAEKADFWPSDRDLDVFQPLSAAGLARAEALDPFQDGGYRGRLYQPHDADDRNGRSPRSHCSHRRHRGRRHDQA
jgi:hypothetical protein